MDEPIDSTELWARALRELWEAAGEPTAAAIARQAGAQFPPLTVTSSSWSELRNGKNVPSDPKIARWLVIFLRGRARQRTPEFIAADDGWWETVWRRARGERQRGGRPHREHPPSPKSLVVERIQVGRIPRPADCFQDRQVAAGVRAAADQGGTVLLTQVLAGMGGVGKTQLAAAYARDAWTIGVGVLVWVNAASRDGIMLKCRPAASSSTPSPKTPPERANPSTRLRVIASRCAGPAIQNCAS